MTEQTNKEFGPRDSSEDSSIIDHLIKIFPNKCPSRDQRRVLPSEGFGRIQRSWNPDSRMMMLADFD